MTTTVQGPSTKQVEWIDRLREEKVLSADMVHMLEAYDNGSCDKHDAKNLLDKLFAAPSVIVLPSTLVSDGNHTVSDKQVGLINSLLSSKVVPDSEFVAVHDLVEQGLSTSHAGRVIDYLFALPAKDQVQTRGFLGYVGGKIHTSGTVTALKTIDSQWGSSKLIVVTTDDGQAVKTFSASKASWELTEGALVEISGTVKAHETYHGNEATVISRPKIIQH